LTLFVRLWTLSVRLWTLSVRFWGINPLPAPIHSKKPSCRGDPQKTALANSLAEAGHRKQPWQILFFKGHRELRKNVSLIPF
jgi:hypothetical protein